MIERKQEVRCARSSKESKGYLACTLRINDTHVTKSQAPPWKVVDEHLMTRRGKRAAARVRLDRYLYLHEPSRHLFNAGTTKIQCMHCTHGVTTCDTLSDKSFVIHSSLNLNLDGNLLVK